MGKQKQIYSLSVEINEEKREIQFFSMKTGEPGTAALETVPFKAPPFSEGFPDVFSVALKEYAHKHPTVAESAITLILPDGAVALDTISVPTLNKRKNEESLTVAVESIYRNHRDLRVNHTLAMQNKQLTTFALSVVNQGALAPLLAACAEAQMTPQYVTYASNAAVNAVSSLHTKLRAASYLLLDIKEDYARFAFVAKGRTTGFYHLPFGYAALSDSKLTPEDMQFEHSVAELVVLNAKEKARAKQLTMMRDELTDGALDDARQQAEMTLEEDEDDLAAAVNTVVVPQTFKSLPRKTPRKLPKFMLRPQPETEEQYVAENFRLFVKWALNLLQANDKLVMQGEPEKVYVNMPTEFASLMETVNGEQEENGIAFAFLQPHNEKEIITRNYDLYGGFFAGQFNATNNF